MNITTHLKNCNKMMKVVINIVPPIKTYNPHKTSINPIIISKSTSYHDIYKKFNVEKYIKDEKKYIKNMINYYNS